METIRPPAAGNLKTAWKPIRRPLQPRNVPASHATARKRGEKQQGGRAFSNKENCPLLEVAAAEVAIEPVGASLAEELESVRRKLERLRSERERTERLLRERGLALEVRLKEMEGREEEVGKVRVEVDRVLEWKKLRASTAVGSVKTLREQAQEKVKEEYSSINEEQLAVQNRSCTAFSSNINNVAEASSCRVIIQAAPNI